MNKPRHYLALLLCFTALGSARALEWDRKLVAATPAPGDEVVRVRYAFKNPAKKTVHILGVTTSCGCTEATPSASQIAPGESGAVDVVFTIGQRTGLQKKEITIRTDESETPVTLELNVTLPPAPAH